MNRIDMYLDNKGSIVMEFFKTVDSENSYKRYRGAETYEIIKKIASKKITDACEIKRQDCLLIGYNDLGVNIYEPNELIYKRGMGPLVKKLKEFKEKEELQKIEKKKVTRKNKYNSQRIVAGSLSAVALLGIALGVFGKQEKNVKPQTLSTIIVGEYDEDKNIDNFLIFDDVETIEEEIIPISINFEDRSDTSKAYETKSWYGETITKYAKRYGVDPKLVLAIATQERGIHSEVKDVGGATGLMQLQNGVWENNYIEAYNFETNKLEKEYVTEDKIKDVFNNIRFGCMYLQNCMEYMNYNTVAAVQCYNMGYKNMMKILKAYSLDTGKSVPEILNDKYDTGWLDYRYIIDVGDKNYAENVFSWVGNDFEIKTQKSDKTSVATKISNEMVSKKIY